MKFVVDVLALLFAAIPLCTNQAAEIPGVIIDHSPAVTRQYVGSPSIVQLRDHSLLASHDWFGPGTTQSRTVIFASADTGETWRKLSEVEGQFWSSLFLHRDALYLLGTSRQEGFVVIRKSTDGGRTWTEPKDRKNGLLLADAKYHCAPVPVLEHNGRLWRAMEDAMGPAGWAKHFRAFMMSIPVEANLLEAEQWTCSNRLGYNPEWLDGKFGGWLEGNAVVAPDGRLLNILRVDYRAGSEKAAVIEVSADGRNATFDPERGFIDFPGGCKKFTIRFDSLSRLYWSLSNDVPEAHRNPNPERTRNTLALISSPDLRQWQVRTIVLQHPDRAHHGFQYADWLISGPDLLAVVRTAFDDATGGAHNQHDANYLTFHRVKNFRRFAEAK
ncbi:MAG: sialidase family protein [Verrucomicrobiota bacterium]|jgi:hypothetical protein